MKNIKFLFVSALLFLTNFAFSQTKCYAYVPEKIGSKWEITSFNPKGKKDNVTKYELLNKTTSVAKITYEIKAISYDKKGEEIFNSSFEASCENGYYSVDMKSILDASLIEAYKDLDVKIESTAFELPDENTAVGTELKDASMTIEVNVGMIIKMNVSIEDRKLDAKEKKTTTAGTFDCIKIGQNTVMTGIVKMKASSIEWYSEGVGLVRSENYNNKGKLTGYSELTKLD